MNAYGTLGTFVFVALIVATSIECVKIHERMTDDEIANLFHTTRDKIPEYEVVPIKHNRHKRSDPNLRLQFTAFGKKIDTYLQPSDGQLAGRNTPVWLAFTKPDGKIEYKRMREDIVGIVAGYFNSPIDLSTVVVNEAKGKDNPSFEGLVGDFRIRSLPARLQGKQRSKRKISDASKPLIDTNFHVIIKSSLAEDEPKLREVERQIREASLLANKTKSSKAKRESKDIIYPSILINTDFKGSKTSQNDLHYYDEIMYQLAFWNGVDLRFRHVENPKVRLRIAGIIIGQDRTATPYMNNHRKGDVINMSEGWSDMQSYWGKMSKRPDFPLDAYDVVVTMTNYDMTNTNKDGSVSDILGLAAVRGLCLWGWPDKYYALAVVKDNGGFDGFLTAAHELGHIMGLKHDSNSGDECDKSIGFIMQPIMKVSLRNLEWSPCSLKSLSYFLREPGIYCADKPAEFYPPGPTVPRFLPGDILDTHKQCQGRGYAWACDPYPEMCTHMNCYYTGWTAFLYGWWCENAGPAAEGTICAPNHKCVDGVCQCVSEECIFEKKQ